MLDNEIKEQRVLGTVLPEREGHPASEARDLADKLVLADVEQPVAAVASGDRHDAAVGEERV